MNRHRKAESRQVKAYIRILRAVGRDTTYKKARRHVRKRNRTIRDLPKNVNRGLSKGVKRCSHSMTAASKAFASLAEHAAVILGRTSIHPLGIVAVTDSLALYQEALIEKKLSEDKPKREFRRKNYVFLDESAFTEATPALWPKENPHIPKEETSNE